MIKGMQSWKYFEQAVPLSSYVGPLITKGAALTFKGAAHSWMLLLLSFPEEPLVDGDVEEVGDLSLEAMKDKEVATANEVFEGAFGALGVRLGLKVEALVDAIEVMVVDDN
nr:hypothetical protein [Tanacetum cinerariifolium]